jgi:hypothetical protein
MTIRRATRCRPHMRHTGIGRAIQRSRLYSTRRTVTVCALAWTVSVMLAADARAQNDLSLITPRPEYVNELKNSSEPGVNPPADVSTSAVMFNGTIGAYAVPGSLDPAEVPMSSNARLESSSFGQPFARDIPYPDFANEIIREARSLLFYQDAINAGKNPLEAAFRFINLLYDVDPDTAEPFSLLDIRIQLGSTNAADLLMAMYDARTDDGNPFNETEGERAARAERMVREAIRLDPLNEDLSNTMLDIAYARAIANGIFAKEMLVQAYQQTILPAPPGGFVVDNEIQFLTLALELYETATNPYYELFQDRIGINTQLIDPSEVDNPPYGYYIYEKLVPRRPMNVDGFAPREDGTFNEETGEYEPGEPTGGTLLPLVDQHGNPIDLVFNGFKDWALMWDNLRDQMNIVADLAKRYAIRGGVDNEGKLDIDKARELIDDAQKRGLLSANVLIGIFPDYDPPPNDMSGIQASIVAAYQAIGDLDTVREFIDGGANLLGFQDDFLMLVQSFAGQQETFDSFDSLRLYLQQSNTPLLVALTDFDSAVASYNTYRGAIDQLTIEYARQVRSIRDRLFMLNGTDPGNDPTIPLDPAYFTPEATVGSDIYLQIQSIESAKLQIQRNQVEISNLQQQIAIEIARRAQEAAINASIQDVIIDYGDKQAQMTEYIGAINAAQAAANAIASAVEAGGATPPNVAGAIGHSVNAAVQAAAEVGKSLLEAEKERMAAQERAEILALEDQLLDVNSQANIQTWLLEMNTLAVDSLQASLTLAQEVARLVALHDEQKHWESRLREAGASLVGRYFADPVHRLRYQSNMLDAEQGFRQAQNWVFFLVRAFEYKWNTPFIYNNARGTWSIQSVYRARNAKELDDVVDALVEFDGLLQGTSRGDDRFDWFSFKEDFLGYEQFDRQGNPRFYVDPDVGDLVDATTLFRRHLKKNMDSAGVIRLRFSTVRDRGDVLPRPALRRPGRIEQSGPLPR